MRDEWRENPDLYERDLNMPADLYRMRPDDWRAHYEDIFNGRAGRMGDEYWEDPLPWGENRPEGAPDRRDAEWRQRYGYPRGWRG